MVEWTVETRSDGMAFVATAGVDHGLIRIRERIKPLRRARDIFGNAEPFDELTTCEGESAAYQESTVGSGATTLARACGIVFADDAYWFVDGGTTLSYRRPVIEAAVRDHTRMLAIGLGHRRVRRYRYTPPPGWTAVPRALATAWWHPNYPATPTELVVHPAQPVTRPRAELYAALVAHERLCGREVGAAPRGLPVFARDGLAGSRWSSDGLSVVILEDERFLYPVLARGPAESELADLVASMQAIPLPAPRASQDAMLHWAL